MRWIFLAKPSSVILSLVFLSFGSSLLHRSIQMFKIKQENLVGLKINGYTFLRKIGQGQYGRVYEVLHEQRNEYAAAKVIPRQLMKQKPEINAYFQVESNALKRCRNQNVVRFIDSFKTDSSLILVMELCDGGELQEYLNKKGRLTESEATVFLKQILNGFKGLHELQIMHRDIKAQNILLRQGICKIADLGFAKQVKEGGMTTTILGTGLTMAPQVHQHRDYTWKADLWSVAVVYYQMIYGDYPFKGPTDKAILSCIKTTRPDFSKVNLSDKAKDFIEKCLVINPKERMSWKQVYFHPLIVEQDKIVYSGRAPSIRLEENQMFYEKQMVEEAQAMKKEEEIKEEWTKGGEEEWTKGQQEPVEEEKFEHLQAVREELGRTQKSVKDWLARYIARRNGIMFIFKQMVPFILRLHNNQVHANHVITLFIICKRAYHQSLLFEKQLNSKENFIGQTAYFQEFLNSVEYKQICDIVQDDCDLIQLQTKEYIKILPKVLNQPTRRELNLEAISHPLPQWIKFVQETVDGYEDELIGQLDSISLQLKKDVIKLVEGLHYYRTRGHEASIEEFDKKMEVLNFEKAETILRERWIKKITKCL